MAQKSRKTRKIARGAHNGAKIHHQDQVATIPVPVNFKTRKIKNSTVKQPIPLEDDLLSAISNLLSTHHIQMFLYAF